jgi:hypothetical protein
MLAVLQPHRDRATMVGRVRPRADKTPEAAVVAQVESAEMADPAVVVQAEPAHQTTSLAHL